jgi:hypothetical protein
VGQQYVHTKRRRDDKNHPLASSAREEFFQWQVMVPLGLEYEFYQKKFGIRLEVAPGIVGSRYRRKSFAAREAHGAGIWLLYRPKQSLIKQ